MQQGKDIRRCSLKVGDLQYGSNIELNEDLSSAFHQNLVDSVKRYGVIEPLLVLNGSNGARHVKVGNTRLWAARQVGIDFVDCIVVTLERDIGIVPTQEGRVVTDIHAEYEYPIHWTERENYVALKCTHFHMGEKEVS